MPLEALEKGEQGGARPETLMEDLPLFQATPPSAPPAPAKTSHLEEKLAEIHPDALSPREALTLLYELKALSDET